MSVPVRFTVYAKAEPQGSAKGFVVNGRAIVTSDNGKMRSYRAEVTREARAHLAELGIAEPLAGKHVPVAFEMRCFFRRPPSVPKRRTHMVVKPDLSKLLRATEDAMIGILYADDSQIVEEHIRKDYAADGIERVEIAVRNIAEVGNAALKETDSGN